MASTTRKAIAFIAAIALLAGCSGSEKIAIPSAESIESISICQGYRDCDLGKFSVNDRLSIEKGLREVAAQQTDWQTETQMAWSTGWFTYPTPMESVVFREKNGDAVLVLWFGPGWIGTAVTQQNRRVKYFKKAPAADVANLRKALRMTGRDITPPPAAAERPN